LLATKRVNNIAPEQFSFYDAAYFMSISATADLRRESEYLEVIRLATEEAEAIQDMLASWSE